MKHVIVREISRPRPELLAALQAAAPWTVGYAGPLTGSRGMALDPAIKPLRLGARIFGPAVTVALDKPDLLLPMYAITLAQPGDVLVIAAGGDLEAAVWGGSMTKSSTTRGLSGVVIDGVSCDSGWLVRPDPVPGASVPIFARGSAPGYTSWEQPGSINVPVTCAGRVVEPGDLIVGDDDGVVVVPSGELEPLLPVVERFVAETVEWHAAMDAGQTWFEVLDLKSRLRALSIPERG